MAAASKPTFNIFDSPTKEGIDVGYISSDRGYVQNVTICEANEYAKSNPGTVFIVRNREFVKYLGINSVNTLNPQDLIPQGAVDECAGYQEYEDPDNTSSTNSVIPKPPVGPTGIDVFHNPNPCKPTVHFYGGGGVGVAANPITGTDGAVLAVDVVRGGFGYKYPPQVDVKDTCNQGNGVVAKAYIDEDLEVLHYYDDDMEVEDPQICDDDIAGFGRRYNAAGKDVGPWDPSAYKRETEKTDYQRAVDEYQRLIAEYTRPWKSLRDNKGAGSPVSLDSITWSSGRTTKEQYNVKWGGYTAPEDLMIEETFKVFTEGGKKKTSGVVGTDLKFTFKSADGSHTFSIKAESFVNRAAAEPVKIKLHPNTVYNVVSSGNYKGKGKTEQGLLVPERFGKIGGWEQDRGTSDAIFTDLIGSADDDDDLQVQCTIGKFTAGKGIETGKGHDSWAITYKLVDNSINNADAGSSQGSGSDADTSSDGWGAFMNKNAVSPIPPSDVPGSDHAGEVFTFEWDLDFPTQGEYVFKGAFDGDQNYGNFYVDNEKIGEFLPYDQKPISTIAKIYDPGPHTLRFDLKNNAFKKAIDIQPTISDNNVTYDGMFVREGNKYFYYIEKANDLVSIDFEFQWAETQDKKMTVTKIILDTEDEPLQFEIPKLDAEPPASLPNISMQVPWVKSYQGRGFTNWVNNPYVEFLRTYAVFPVTNSSLNGVTQTGVWTIDISTPGTYTLELSSDDTSRVEWDGNFVGETTWDESQFGPKVFTINGVTVGKHELKGEVTNNPRYGASWYDNPGGIAWLLRNSSGAIVRTSTHDFNTQLPQGFRAVAFGVTRMAGDINKIIFEGMNFTASGDITNTTTDVQNAVVEEGIAYKLSYYGSGGRTCFFKVEYNGTAIGLDDDGGSRRHRVGYYVGANLLVSASEGEFYEQDGSFYYKVRKSNLQEDLGKGGSGYQPKGNILKTGTFKDGKKYRVVFEQEDIGHPSPQIRDTGIFNNKLTRGDNHDDQILNFRPVVDKKEDGSYILVPDPNALLAARNAKQLSPPKKVAAYPEHIVASSIEQRSIFNTMSYIDKANRPLWKFPKKGGFLGEYGVVPFDTGVKYKGSGAITTKGGKKLSKKFWLLYKSNSATGYTRTGELVDIETDDRFKVYHTGKKNYPTITWNDDGTLRSWNDYSGGPYGYGIRPDGSGVTQAEVQAMRKVWKKGGRDSGPHKKWSAEYWGGSGIVRTGLQSGGGIYGGGGVVYDFVSTTGGKGKSSWASWGSYHAEQATVDEVAAYEGLAIDSGTGDSHAGTHTIVWSNITFPISANYKIEIQVDDNVRLKIGDKVDIYKEGFVSNAPQITPTGKSTYSKFVEKGTYTITADLEQSAGGELGWDAGQNSLVLGVNIEAEIATKEVLDDSKSWNENPMGVAITVDSPLPLPPVQALPPWDGECPPNPIWHTRFPNAEKRWSPVIGFPFWSKVMNTYPISPIPPFDEPGTDGTGTVYSNSWTVDLPYDGEYGLRGAVDNWGRILIDGNPIQRFTNEELSSIDPVGVDNNTLGDPVQKKPPLTRIPLTKGEHTITVEVENWKNYEIPRTFIDKKIFSTQDWQAPIPKKKSYVDVDFDVSIQTLLGAGIEIKGLFERSKDYGADGIGAPPPPVTAEDTFRVYWHGVSGMEFKFTSADGSHEFTFKNSDYKAKTVNTEGPIHVIPNMDYTVMASYKGRANTGSNQVEQGLIPDSQFGSRRPDEKDTGTGKAIFADKLSSSNDNDDIQVEAQAGLFTAGAEIPIDVSGDSFHLTYRLSVPIPEPPAPDDDRYRNLRDKFSMKVEKGRVYDVRIHSEGKWRLTGERSANASTISYVGLNASNNPIRVNSSRKRLSFKDSGGNDTNGWFDIDSVTGGTAKFNSSGKSIDVTGKNVQIKLTYGWNDSASYKGKALDQIKIGKTTWTQTNRKKGSQTRTITLSSGYPLGGDGSKHFQLRTQGDNVIQMEDLWGWEGVGGGAGRGPWFDDVVCATSEGKFFDIQGETAKWCVGPDVETTLVRNGVEYVGPRLYNYQHAAYGKFLNKKGVSPDYPKIGGVHDVINYTWSNVDFDTDGEYEFHFANDAHGSLYFDGEELIRGAFDDVAGVSAFDRLNFNLGQRKKVFVNKGKHIIAVAPSGRLGEKDIHTDGLFRKLSADYYKGQQAWENNPSAMAVNVTLKVETFPEEGSAEAAALNLGPDYFRNRKGKSWVENPLAISAALIPAPCKQKAQGKGVVTRVEIIDPGCNYPPPNPPPGITTYPVILTCPKIIVINPGINYNPGPQPKTPGIGTVTPPGIGTATVTPPPGSPPPPDDPEGDPDGKPDDIELIPPEGGEYKAKFDPYGRITEVVTVKPGMGFTQFPTVKITSSTGTNFEGVPLLEPVRDPIYLSPTPDQLIQVTDLVGIKQTGYYKGRPYYGAVFYKEGLRYAGYYETAGELIRVYDTLQESIDGEVTTPPSAIQRQGTDINSNDPRLNIPDTPQNLT